MDGCGCLKKTQDHRAETYGNEEYLGEDRSHIEFAEIGREDQHSGDSVASEENKTVAINDAPTDERIGQDIYHETEHTDRPKQKDDLILTQHNAHPFKRADRRNDSDGPARLHTPPEVTRWGKDGP